MSDSRYYSKEFITDVIEMYKGYPCLWKIKSDDFKNRNLKDKAYGELVKKFQEVDPKADKQVVLKKFSSWRNSWKKEFKKVKESLKLGSDTDLIYTPKLWYFEILSFIEDQEIIHKSPSTLLDEDDMSTTREEEKVQEEQDDFTEESLMESPHTSKDSQGDGNVENSQSDSSVSFKRSRLSYPRHQIPQKEQLTTETDFDDLVKTIMSKIENSDNLDRFDYLAKNWGEKLRNIDPTQRIYVEKLVTDVFYEAELRSLSRNSRVIVGGGSQLPYPEPQNIFPSLAPRHSPQPFTSSFTPGTFASQYQQSNGSDQPTQAQITDDNFVIVKDEI
ncbi:UNVERIFIED_CONTAM: hypothetical protein RMT77_017344 [Armadillidium vulgare]